VPSAASRLVSVWLRLSGVKRRMFDPKRFAGPSARARKRDAHRPPRSLARHLTVDRLDFEGWPCYVLKPRSGGAAGRIVYLHGGAYAAEIIAPHWRFVARLAEVTDRIVTVPIYPLTPEHDHLEVFPTLLRLFAMAASEHGAERLALMGDSAGAGMALALVQSLPPGSPRPGDLILLSPWLDVTMTHPDIAAIARRDVVLDPEHLKVLGRFYAGPDEPSVAQVSPINGPLTDLGRVALFTGTNDVLHPDARRLHDLAARSGTDIAFYEYDGMFHDWMLAPIPEARRVRSEIVEMLRARSTR
jgi:acetyl esterase/lipase